jgi:hypothetical protein
VEKAAESMFTSQENGDLICDPVPDSKRRNTVIIFETAHLKARLGAVVKQSPQAGTYLCTQPIPARIIS